MFIMLIDTVMKTMDKVQARFTSSYLFYVLLACYLIILVALTGLLF